MAESTLAVILAGGAGTRWDGPGHKLAAPVDGVRAVLRRAVDAAVAAGLDEVAVVLGALPADVVELPTGVTVLVNDGWADGQASSLALAVEYARAAGHGAVVVGLGDQPGLAPDAWRRVASSVDTPVAVATYDGRRGHPVRFAAVVWPDLPTTGETPGRALTACATRVTEVACPGFDADVDTVADLETLIPHLTEEPSCN